MPRKLDVLFITIMVLNLFYIHSYQASSAIVSEPIVTIQRKTKAFQNVTLLEHGIRQNQTFTNESVSHNWVITTITSGQVVFFSIEPKKAFTISDFQVTLYNPEEIEVAQDTPVISTKYLGSWTVSRTGNWTLQINDTRSNKTENYPYNIIASIPTMGYSDNSALYINETVIAANFTVDHEVQYWKVSLEENQNCTIYLKEISPDVLSEAEVTIYSKSLGKGNPVSVEEILAEPYISYNYSWNAFFTDDYIIEIRHKTQYVGLYNISYSAAKDYFNFFTAGRLPYNKTIYIKETHSYISPKRYYFWFLVNSSRSDVKIRICELNNTIQENNELLNYADIEIYDTGLQDPIHREQEQYQLKDGEINISIKLDEGKYYLVISPKTEAKGTFSIHFEYQLPKPFVWSLISIFISFIVLIAFPAYLIYLDSKGKWYRINQWTVTTSVQEAYKFLKYNFSGIFSIKEVPNESILIKVTGIPIKTFSLINFVESSEEETLIISKRIHRNIEWIIYFFIGVIIFDIINILGYSIFSSHLLPIYISDFSDLLFLLVLPTLILIFIVYFVNIFVYTNYHQIINRISFIVQNYQESLEKGITFHSLDPDQARKNINYVRVLWNQAKHAFKESNYELFVIKADASVKNLLITRFQQFVETSLVSKPDFLFQVKSLRNRGFDLPSEKKIAHFRNLRNRIVHSSVTLDEKESVDCFAFYSTFITRLGLRST